MKKRIQYTIIFLFAFLFGIGIAVFRIANYNDAEITIINGVWKTDREMDLGNDKLLTARIAIAALFALKNSEVIYMIADKDNAGNPLSSDSDYIISGEPINSRYWSITLYGPDYFLIPNEINRFSFNLSNVSYETDSTFNIQISSQKKNQNWLPSGNQGKFYLLLRMYHPAPEVYEHLETVKLPDIQKIAP